MAGSLTTHVLDVTQGQPAANMVIELWKLDTPGTERTWLKTTYTDSDGRPARPLLHDDEMLPGAYELVFAVGTYFSKRLPPAETPPFLDRVPVRFRIADPNAHYHVPLLTSPWAYSTYRGS